MQLNNFISLFFCLIYRNRNLFVFKPNKDVLKILLKDRPKNEIVDIVSRKTERQETPLYIAIRNHNEKIVKFLLDSGASPSEACLRVNIYSKGILKFSETAFILKKGSGWSAVHEAAIQNNPKILNMLLATGVSPNLIDNSGKTPLLGEAL